MAHVKKTIQELEKFKCEALGRITANPDLSDADYSQIRSLFNAYVIQGLIGTNLIPIIQDGQTKYKTKGFKKLPSQEELIQILDIIEDFLLNVESLHLSGKSANPANSDDMKTINPEKQFITEIEDITTDKFKEMIEKNAHKQLVSRDFRTLARLAKKLRRRNIIKYALMLAGIVVVVAGGAALAGVFSKKENHSRCDRMIDDTPMIIEPDENDIPMIVDNDDDTPMIVDNDEEF